MDDTKGQSPLPSHTVPLSSNTMGTTWKTSSTALRPSSCQLSYIMMNTFKKKPHNRASSHSMPLQDICTYIPSTSHRSEQEWNLARPETQLNLGQEEHHGRVAEVEVDASPEMKHATDGTVGRTAMNPPAFSNTNAGPAAGPIAKNIAADLNECQLRQQLWQARAARPKYLRGYVWSSVASRSACTPLLPSEHTAFTPPLPSPPKAAFSCPQLNEFIASNPHLFLIVTLIHVNSFSSLLSSHPNRALIDSVCDGLSRGFWPLADLSGLDPIFFLIMMLSQTENETAKMTKNRTSCASNATKR